MNIHPPRETPQLIHGLGIDNDATNPNTHLVIFPIVATVTDGTRWHRAELKTAITKRIDEAWAAGDGEGGRFTAGATNNTHDIWLIRRLSDGLVDVAFTSAGTSLASMLAGTATWGGEIRARRIQSFRTDGSGNILAGVWTADRFTFKEYIILASGTSPATSWTLLNTPAPHVLGCSARIQVRAQATANSINRAVSAIPGHLPDPSTVGVHGLRAVSEAVANISDSVVGDVEVDSSGRIKYAATSATSISFNILAYGWIDNRGRE